MSQTTNPTAQQIGQVQVQQRSDPISSGTGSGIDIDAQLSFEHWQKHKSCSCSCSCSLSLRPCHDGHTPEGLVDNKDSSSSCQRVYYDALTEESIPIIHVTDQAVDPTLCQAWYDTMSRTTTTSATSAAAAAATTSATIKTTSATTTTTTTTETTPTSNNNSNNNKSWGTYVTMSEIYEYWQQHKGNSHDAGKRPETAAVVPTTTTTTTTTPATTATTTTTEDLQQQHQYRHGLAVATAARLVQQAWNVVGSSSPTCTYTTNTTTTKATTTLNTATSTTATNIVRTEYTHDNYHHPDSSSSSSSSGSTPPPSPPNPTSMPDWWRRRKVHGVAVWALISSQGMAVPYHMDYAEQLRYARNIIATPLWGGILHCTPSPPSSSVSVAWSSLSQNENVQESIQGGDYYVYLQSPESSWEHYQRHGYKSQLLELNEGNRITIPYRTNRLIAQAGYLPHGSTAVTALPTGVKGRVVVGMNVFGADVGGIVQALPEHSPQFNTWVTRLRQERRGVPLRTLVQRRPQAARRLLQQKSKADYQRAVQQLAMDLEQALSSRQSSHREHDGLTMSELQSKFARHDGRYPSPTDIWVYIQHRCGTLFEIIPDDNVDAAASKELRSEQQRIRLLLPKQKGSE
eukprot:scaffold34647_cov182-Amphora_coffeaeformis.AAC.2